MVDAATDGHDDDRLSLITPVGYSCSSCGYCPPPGSGRRSAVKSSKSYGLWSHSITPHAYQALLNRGWRRSGSYVYRPDNGIGRTCCPQVAIRVHVDAFVPHRQHRRAIASLQRLVRTPQSGLRGMEAGPSATITPSRSRLPMPSCSFASKGKYARAWDVEQEWDLIEWKQEEDALLQELSAINSDQIARHNALARYHTKRAEQACALRREAEEEIGVRKDKGKGKGKSTSVGPPRPPRCRRLETKLCLADSTLEKYELFRMYQMRIHGEAPDKVSSRPSFERFLCKAPIMSTMPGSMRVQQSLHAGDEVSIGSKDPIPYDLYHMEWRYEGKLIAVGVLDVLPQSVSSVYLFYDPDHSGMQLGKISALREIALVRQLRRKRGMSNLRYYNMGLYIHQSPKMRYKAQFGPAEVLDPLTCTWESLASASKALDRNVRFGWMSSAEDQESTTDKTGSSAANDTRSENDAPEYIRGNSSAGSEEEGGESNESEDEDREMPRPPPPGVMDPDEIDMHQLARCFVLGDRRVDLLLHSRIVKDPAAMLQIRDCLAALGPVQDYFCLVPQ